MIKLIESKLFGAKLFPVDTKLMKKRYNECLTDIGIEVTNLGKFHIDGWGWSPEIAKESDPARAGRCAQKIVQSPASRAYCETSEMTLRSRCLVRTFRGAGRNPWKYIQQSLAHQQ